METASTAAAPWEADVKTEKIMRAAYRALYPVAKLFLRYIHGAVLGDLFQRILVDIAHNEIRHERHPQQRHKKITLTELNLKTGLDTRRLRRLMEQPLVVTEHNICVEAAILARWAKDPALREQYQRDKPRDLIAYGRDGTFEGIVKSIAGRGVSATPVLDRMIQRGNVKWVSKYHIRLIDPAWQFLESNEDDDLEAAANSIALFCSTLQHNLCCKFNNSEPRTERHVYSYMVPSQHRDALEKALKEKLLQARNNFYQTIAEYENSDADDSNHEAIGVSFFLFRQKTEPGLNSCAQLSNKEDTPC